MERSIDSQPDPAMIAPVAEVRKMDVPTPRGSQMNELVEVLEHLVRRHEPNRGARTVQHVSLVVRPDEVSLYGADPPSTDARA